MKKLTTKFLVVTFVLIGYTSVQAQEKGASELKVGYGLLSTSTMGVVFNETIAYSLLSLGTVSLSNDKYTGTIYLGYSYAIADRFVIGTDVSYERISKDVNLTSSGTKIGEEKNNIFTFAIKSDYHYVSNPKFRMYSGLGVGYTNINSKLTSNAILDSNGGFFNFQVTAIGLRFGGKLGVHTELGLGYKGIFAIGLNYQF